MTSSQIELLKQTNDLIKEIESANGLEQLQEIASDMKEREQKTKEFNQLFNENHIEDEELDQLYHFELILLLPQVYLLPLSLLEQPHVDPW